MEKQPAIYIVTNKKDGTLYVGVTSNLIQRISQHKNGLIKGFAFKYNCKLLVYYELLDSMESAISREKQVKGGSRKDKIKLMQNFNPDWDDLYESIL